MAIRTYFKSTPNDTKIFEQKSCNFEYFNGFAISQKQKSINSLHSQIMNLETNAKVLEISTKSNNPLGVALSAFNLKFFDVVNKQQVAIENVFQSSKVFENGGPYRDLLFVNPKDAKRDERLKNSGRLLSFNYNNTVWELEPKTMFYDWLYICSLIRNENLSYEILKYNIFTDIEFNHLKSINCQARSAAIFVSLSIMGIVNEIVDNKDLLKKYYNQSGEQIIFDI